MSILFHKLLKAVKDKDIETFKDLVDREHAFETLETDEVSLIFKTAVVIKDFEILQKLFESKFGYFHQYALLYFIQNNNFSLFERLFSRKEEKLYRGEFDVWEFEPSWMSKIIKCAILVHDLRFINVIFDGSDLDIREEIIHRCISEKKPDIMKRLLEKGFDPNTILTYDNPHGDTLLIKAVHLVDVDMVHILIRHGADVNLGNQRTNFPLLEALTRGHDEICKILLNKRPLVDIRGYGYNTPLHLVYSLEMCELLLNAGCCINSPNEDGAIPLYYIPTRDFSLNHISKILVFLIKNGSLVNHIPNNIWLPYYHWKDIYFRYKCDEPYEILIFALKAGLDVEENLWNLGKNRSNIISKIRQDHEENKRKLMFLCRLKIRHFLIDYGKGRSIYPRIHKLPIPPIMQSYLKLEH